MNRFYRVAIDKRPIGTAIEHREPPLQGQRIVNVTERKTQGDFKLMVVEATDAEDQKNLGLPGVEPLTQADAVKLAAEYQPAHQQERRDSRTGKVERIDVPAVDLDEVLRRRAERGRPPG